MTGSTVPLALVRRRAAGLAGLRPACRAACLAFGLAIALTACAVQPAPAPTAPPPDPRATYVPGASAIVCYRTLAAPDCYAAAQPGPPNRFIGAYGDQTGADYDAAVPRVAPEDPMPLTTGDGS